MLVAGGQRKIMFQRYRRNPDIVLRDRFSEPCQVSIDSTVVMSRALIDSEEGA
jgi:hypothetical protein